jgi:hypothetical protein
MPDQRKYSVFLSYSAKDRQWVSQFQSALSEAGIRAWFDVENILPGDRWEDQIQKALRESTTLVVILSSRSIQSPWTFFELGAAVADGKRIIPILTEDIDMRHVPVPLARFQLLREPSPVEAGKRVAEVLKEADKKEP